MTQASVAYRQPSLSLALLRRKLAYTLAALHFRLWVADLVLAPLPILLGRRFRAFVYRLAGLRIGPACRYLGRATFDTDGNPYERLTVGARSQFGIGCHISLNAPVTIGNDVVLGHYVRILTDNHDISSEHRRCGNNLARPVVIEDGAWLATGVTVLPGVRIGRGSVVAAGAVVTRDVEPNSMVAGVPAHIVRSLETGVSEEVAVGRGQHANVG